jgi:hypothetical protein
MITILAFVLGASAANPHVDLKVSSKEVNYSLSIQAQNFSFESRGRQIHRKIKPCGARAYELFAEKVLSISQDIAGENKIKKDGAIAVVLNKKNLYLSPISPGGVTITKLETDVDYLESEAEYRCSKK